MAAALYRDDPWRRAPWLLPTAAALTALSLMGFLKLLAGPPPLVTALPQPVEVDVVEVAPSLPTPPAPPAWPIASDPPLALEPPPAPPPTPAPPFAQTLPPPPIATDPEPALVPDTRPPPPPLVARTKSPPPPQRTASPQRTAPPVPTPAPSPPTAVAPTPPTSVPAPAITSLPPSGGSMGARAIYQPLPEVPEALRHRAIELVAVARFHVAVNGSAEVELIQPTPDAMLNRALLEALKKWRFFPAMAGGKPEASTIDIRIPISVH